MKVLIKPDNEAEALALKSLLEANGIQVLLRSFHDTAYNGIYQAQYGWGTLSVNETDYRLAQSIVTDWRASAPSADELDDLSGG